MGIGKQILDTCINSFNSFEESFREDGASFLDMERSMQLDGYSCGVQATFSILKYYGKARSIESVDNLLNAYNRGYASESAIYELCRKRKLKVSKREKANLATIKEAIDEYEAPMITTINDGDHWIVVYGYSNSHIYVLDSALPQISVKWSKEKFKEKWDRWGAIIYKQ